MAIVVAEGLREHIVKHSGGFTIQVQGAAGPAEAADALQAAAREIAALDGGWQSAPGLRPGDTNGPKWLSRVATIGSGPFISVDAGALPEELLLSIPEIITRHLREAGVDQALIAIPRPPPPGPTTDGTLSVLLRLYPPPPLGREELGVVPNGWLREAVAWLLADVTDPDRQLTARIGGVEATLAQGEALAFFEQARADRPHGASLTMSAVSPSASGVPIGGLTATRGVSLGAWSQASLVWVATTDATDYNAVDARVAELRAVAERLSEGVAYAFIGIGLDVQALALGYSVVPWNAEGGFDAGPGLEELVDAFVLDAFPYQIIGPPHLRRLGGPPPGARSLAGGRWPVWALHRVRLGLAPDHAASGTGSPRPLLGRVRLRRAQAGGAIRECYDTRRGVSGHRTASVERDPVRIAGPTPRREPGGVE